jgi:hypothetical protein
MNQSEHFNLIDNKLCCIFAYYEKNESYKHNLLFFLENGILNEIDYFIVINGPSTINFSSLNLNYKNIKLIYRENKGFDFGAYSHVVENILQKEYDYYIFLNSSIKGPFLKDQNIKWYQPFLKLFNNNVKIVGTSINIYTNNDDLNLNYLFGHKQPYTHVQSMFFIIDNEYFKYLNKINFFNEQKINNITNFIQLINEYEVGLSQYALINSWNINCILDKYKNLDYVNDIKHDINFSSISGDSYYTNAYFGGTIDPYDVIFFKTNRDILY